MIRIALDGMGGDYAPQVVVEGAVMAANDFEHLEIVLVGQTTALKHELNKHKVLGGDTNVRSGKVLANDGTDPDNTPDAREEYKQAIAEHMTKNPGCDPIKAHSAVMKAKPELAEKLAARGAK